MLFRLMNIVGSASPAAAPVSEHISACVLTAPARYIVQKAYRVVDVKEQEPQPRKHCVRAAFWIRLFDEIRLQY